MIGKLVLSLLLIGSLEASLLDFQKIDRAKQDYLNGNYSKSLKLFKSLNKDEPELNYNIANTLYKLSRYKEAIKYYKRSLGGKVNELERRYNLGNCYFKLKDYDSAILAYKYALKIDNSDDVKHNLELAYKMKYKPKKRKKDTKKSNKKGKDKGKNSKNNKKSKKIDKKSQTSSKLTKDELKKLKKLEQEKSLKSHLKKMLKNSLKGKKVPVIMYRLDRNESSKIKIELKPW